MNDETGSPGFKYMVEFPNKIRIYAVDEHSLSRIIEKYGMLTDPRSMNSSMSARPEESGHTARLPTNSRCPECGGSNIVFDKKHDEATCMSCGLAIDAHKEIQTLKTSRRDRHSGCKITEDEKGFTIIRKSARGRYKVKVSRSTVEEVYRCLKTNGGQLPVSEIEQALDICNTTVYNALRVLQNLGRVRVESDSEFGKNRWLFQAV